MILIIFELYIRNILILNHKIRDKFFIQDYIDINITNSSEIIIQDEEMIEHLIFRSNNFSYHIFLLIPKS
jgi:hypothetical protein